MAYSAGATALTVGYGQFARTPKWTPGRTFRFGFVANLAGFVFGQVRRAAAHLQFVSVLEDRQSFVNTLRDIAGEGPSDSTASSSNRPSPQHDNAGQYGDPLMSNNHEPSWASAPDSLQSPSPSPIETETSSSSKQPSCLVCQHILSA